MFRLFRLPFVGPPMASKAEEFKRQAEESQKRAETAVNSFDKKHWLEVTAHLQKMAAAEEAATKVSSIRRPVARA
jgi:hypothetical protein